MSKVINKNRGYAGREKKPLYLYDNDGYFIKEYESQSDFMREYYPNDINGRPLFVPTKNKYSRGNYGYDLLKDGNFICKTRLGREKLRKYEFIVNSIYCKNLKSEPIEVFNLAGDKIAEFINYNLASKMLNIDASTIWKQVNYKTDSKTKRDLIFKLKPKVKKDEGNI